MFEHADHNHLSDQWLSAYLDCEIRDYRREQITAHLESCPECQEKLHQLEGLRQLLQADRLPETLPTSERLALRVSLRLPRQQTPVRQQAARLGWVLAPAAILSAWGFTQVVFLLSRGVWLAEQLGLFGESTAWLFSSVTYTRVTDTASSLGLLPYETSLAWVSLGDALLWNVLTFITWTAPLALLYLGWWSLWISKTLPKRLNKINTAN